ncbi:DNA alkylation repair protein [Marinilactibacillus sp. XAAS-LB27]|uniref:DNA alkylation repair protein n=1 Tax=Marinilactibacillus sp. XAAS-LB27 TaxID=3114538 RepID=UPI002E179C2D|nr:DNA alkylation repair protein [Marinilactibacillus sp. XAAS-LB27]
MGAYYPIKYYFDKALAEKLALLLTTQDQSFPSKQFIETVSIRVQDKELKERVAVIAEELYAALPKDYPQALSLLMMILGPKNLKESGMFTNGYFLMPVAYYVEKYGVSHLEQSMDALYEITQRHTSEYAIRPFILKNTDQCLAYLYQWREDSNAHVRRLVSEGTRPRLPWAKKMGFLKSDIHQNLLLLDALKNDSSEYVRKSVGNHLNDLSKDEPEIVLSWIQEKGQSIHPGVIKRGLRTLAKQGDSRAQSFLK